jgi:adenylate cyclase
MSLAQKVIERRLAAIMFADVVGYSGLMEANEAETLDALKNRRAMVVEPIVQAFGGRIVKLLGDGFLIEFPSAVNAVKSAIELQIQMVDANNGVPEARQICLRIGINLGDVIEEETDIYGEGVNIAARLEPLAEVGGICISAKVEAEVRGKVEVAIRDLGEQELKNIALPVRVFALGSQSISENWQQQSRPAVKKEFTSLAVLPLTNMSGRSEDDYFADGITEALITELSRFKHLAVVAQGTALAFKKRSLGTAEVGRKLGADFVVEGSIRLVGKRVRVTIQLIDTESGRTAFAERLDREIDDIFSVQDEIVEAIVSRLSFNLMDAAKVLREKNPTSSASAYTSWLRGAAAYRTGNEKGARNHWHEAISLDPNFARALASLAFLYAYWRFSEPDAEKDAEREGSARHFAARAITADKADPNVLNDITSCLVLLGDVVEALRYSDMAFSLSPRDSNTLSARAFAFGYAGRHEDALELVRRSCKFEPYLPPGYASCLGDCLYLNGDFEAALSTYRNLIERPDYFRMNEAACLGSLGRLEEAKLIIQQLPTSFDTTLYARITVKVCALPNDKELWLNGFRKAGVLV